jgi:flagellar motor switch protein FliG
LSDLVEIDDLGLLDSHDLRAVFSQVRTPQLVDALCGVTPVLRAQLLKKLPAARAARLAAELSARGPVEPLTVLNAQRAVIEALCRLSRGGHVAFDVPGDIVA